MCDSKSFSFWQQTHWQSCRSEMEAQRGGLLRTDMAYSRRRQGGDCGWHTLGCHLLTRKRKRRRSRRRIRGPVANDTAIPTGYRVQWQSKYHSKCVRSTEKPFHWDYTEWIIGYCRLYLSLNLNSNRAWLLLWFLSSYFCELYLPYLTYSFQFWLLLVFTGLCCQCFPLCYHHC